MEKGKTLNLWRLLHIQRCILITKTWVSVQFCCRYWNKIRGKLRRTGFLSNRWKLKRKWNLEFCESVCRMRIVFTRLGEKVGGLVVMFLHNWGQLVHDLYFCLFTVVKQRNELVANRPWFGSSSSHANNWSWAVARLTLPSRRKSLMNQRRESAGKILESW